MSAADSRPLAERMRPQRLTEVCGQQHLLGPGKALQRALTTARLHSMVFWGPPGTGKTTLARLIASQARAEFVSLSAVFASIKEVRAALQEARDRRAQQQRGTVLFIDEIHRFNKAQQDAFLRDIEDGTIIFIGATTENPSFELNNALLSRLRVYVLKSLTPEDVRQLIDRALVDRECGLGGYELIMDEAVRQRLADSCDGDARRALNMLEVLADLAPAVDGRARIDDQVLDSLLAGPGLRRFDKQGDIFHDLISALHKSVRGSHPDAALYWLARMLDGGCDPLYIARRLLRMASEDIGNADPRALDIALASWDVMERLGSPEGELALAQCAVYLACAAKSNAVYTAFNEARADAVRGSYEVPPHLRNAPTALMRGLGHGRGYRYAHDEPEGYAAGERYLPAELVGRRYYHPVPRGLEQKIAEKLARLRALDAAS